MNTKFIAYTDGACANNQAAGGQPGGWGVAFLDGRTYSGGDSSTTNNRMELTAAIEALKNTPVGSTVEIFSDSAYLINAFQQKWIPNWIKRNWINSQGKPVENQDLWKRLIKLEQERNVVWQKVKGHSGDKYNELADKLAVEAIPNKKNSTSQLGKVTIELTKENYVVLLNILEQSAKNSIEARNLYTELQQNLRI